MPIIIRGVDAAGQTFKEDTWTIGVNKQGAKIATYHPWQVGDQITIENPVLDRAGEAHVVRVEERRFPEDPFEIGVELNEPQNIWGVKFPPENWQRSTAVTEAARSGEGTPEMVPGPEAPTSSLPAAPESAAASPAAREEAGERAEKPTQASLRAETPSPASAKAEKPVEGQAGPTRPATARPADKVESQKLPDVRKAERQEKKLLRSLREQLETLSGSMRASRADLETHLARFQELQRSCQSEVTKAQDSIERFTQEAIRSATAETEERLRATQERLSTHFVEETRRCLQEEMGRAVEASSREVDARLAALAEEHLSRTEPQLQSSLDQAREKASEHISRLLHTTAADEVLKFRKQLAELSTAALEGFLRYIEVQSAGIQTELQTNLGRVQERVVQDASGQLQKTVQELMQSSAQVLQRQADDALEQVVRQLRSREQEFLEETEKQLTALARSARETLARETSLLLEESRGQFRQAVQELQARSARELEAQLQKAAGEQCAALLKQFQRELDDSRERGVADVRTKVQEAAQEASEKVYKQVGVMALMMKEWEERARSTLDACLQEAVETFRKQSVEVSQGTLEKHRQESEGMLDDVRSRLQQAVRILADTGPEQKKT